MNRSPLAGFQPLDDNSACFERVAVEFSRRFPTGLAPYNAKQVEVRKAKRKPAPDNLATESPESSG